MSGPSYRRAYENKRLNAAYRRFVDGGGDVSLTDLVKSSGYSKRQLQRYSSRDEWVTEQEERKAQAAVAASLLTQMAAMAPDATAAGGDGVIPGAKDIILGVLKRHQQFWDRIERHVVTALDEMERKATERKQPLNIGNLVQILTVAEKASANVRKAYGIPERSTMELTGKNGGPVTYRDVSEMTDEELDAELARLEREASGPASRAGK